MPVAYVGYNGSSTFGSGVQWVNQLLPDAFPNTPAVPFTGNITTPVLIGSANTGSGTSLVITTSQNVTATDAIIVITGSQTGNTQLSTLLDSGAVNAYTVATADTTSPGIGIATVFGASALASGGTITCNFSGIAARHAAIALTVHGLNSSGQPVVAPAPATVTSQTISINKSPTTEQDLFIGIASAGSANPGAWTAGTDFTTLGTVAVNCFLAVFYKIVGTSAGDTFAATSVTSVACRAALAGYKTS